MTIESQKSIWIAAAVLALIFLAGGLAGAAIALFARRPAPPHEVMMERIHLPEVPPAPGAPGIGYPVGAGLCCAWMRRSIWSRKPFKALAS